MWKKKGRPAPLPPFWLSFSAFALTLSRLLSQTTLALECPLLLASLCTFPSFQWHCFSQSQTRSRSYLDLVFLSLVSLLLCSCRSSCLQHSFRLLVDTHRGRCSGSGVHLSQWSDGWRSVRGGIRLKEGEKKRKTQDSPFAALCSILLDTLRWLISALIRVELRYSQLRRCARSPSFCAPSSRLLFLLLFLMLDSRMLQMLRRASSSCARASRVLARTPSPSASKIT